jgi:uncharacterized OsmC-like protein
MAELHVDAQVGSGSRWNYAEILLDHPWTDAGISVDAEGTGAHFLLASVGVCVLNDVYREAQPGVQLDGVRVRVSGDFDAETWSMTTVTYEVEIDSPDDEETVARLLERVDAVAEIPRLLAGEVTVNRR